MVKPHDLSPHILRDPLAVAVQHAGENGRLPGLSLLARATPERVLTNRVALVVVNDAEAPLPAPHTRLARDRREAQTVVRDRVDDLRAGVALANQEYGLEDGDVVWRVRVGHDQVALLQHRAEKARQVECGQI